MYYIYIRFIYVAARNMGRGTLMSDWCWPLPLYTSFRGRDTGQAMKRKATSRQSPRLEDGLSLSEAGDAPLEHMAPRQDGGADNGPPTETKGGHGQPALLPNGQATEYGGGFSCGQAAGDCPARVRASAFLCRLVRGNLGRGDPARTTRNPVHRRSDWREHIICSEEEEVQHVLSWFPAHAGLLLARRRVALRGGRSDLRSTRGRRPSVGRGSSPRPNTLRERAAGL